MKYIYTNKGEKIKVDNEDYPVRTIGNAVYK